MKLPWTRRQPPPISHEVEVSKREAKDDLSAARRLFQIRLDALQQELADRAMGLKGGHHAD